MANDLGRTVIHRDMYARSWALGDRRNPSTSTPCLVTLEGDIPVDSTIAPFSSTTDEEIPVNLKIESRLPLSPPDFETNSPFFSTSVGHVLPPSLDEANAGEVAGSGPLLPVSWQRLSHDPELLDDTLNPSIVVLVDAPQLAGQQGRLVKAVHVLKNRFPGALLWTPGLGGPDNAALLTWIGVDIFDLSRSRQCAASQLLLTESGPREIASGSTEEYGMDSQLRHWVCAINEIKSRLASGTLRALVEKQSLNSPRLVEHLRHHDEICRLDTNVGISHVQRGTILHCNSHTSLDNPVITKWVDFMMNSYQAPENLDKVLILLPCSARKPYRMSKSHRKFLSTIGNTVFHEVMVTSPLGLVPRDLEEVWPASHYDIPVTGKWSYDEFERTFEMVKSLISRHNYHTVINHSSMSFDLEAVDYYETREGLGATSKQALDKLKEVVQDVSNSMDMRNRRHHKILMDNFRSVARYKMLNDDWLDGVQVRGKPPYWKLEKSGKQVAQWSNDRRGFSLSKSSVMIISENNSLKKVVIKPSVNWKGDIFSTILIDYDKGIQSGDDILVIQNDKPVGLARATASGWEWTSVPGIVAKAHQRI